MTRLLQSRMSTGNANCFKHWRLISLLSTMPSSLNRSLSEWPAHFLCRPAHWKTADGCIRRGSLWAADGPAGAAHPATRARNQPTRKYMTSAILDTPGAVVDCPKNALTMRCDFRLLAIKATGCRFGSYASLRIALQG